MYTTKTGYIHRDIHSDCEAKSQIICGKMVDIHISTAAYLSYC